MPLFIWVTNHWTLKPGLRGSLTCEIAWSSSNRRVGEHFVCLLAAPLIILCQCVAGGTSHFPGRWQICMWILSGWEAKLIKCFLCNCYNPQAITYKGPCPVNNFQKKGMIPAPLLEGTVSSFHCRGKGSKRQISNGQKRFLADMHRAPQSMPA